MTEKRFYKEIDILQRLLTSLKPHINTLPRQKIQGLITLKSESSERMSGAVGLSKSSLNAPKNKFFGKMYFKWRPLTPLGLLFQTLLNWRVQAVIPWEIRPARNILRSSRTLKIEPKFTEKCIFIRN